MMTEVQTDSRAKDTTARKRAKTPRRRRGPSEAAKLGIYSKNEVASIVCNLFCDAYTVGQIKARVSTEYEGVKLTREDYYGLIRWAAKRGWLRYHPPLDFALADWIQERFPWMKSVRVVDTAVRRDVANQAAESLVRILKAHRSRGPEGATMSIGFTGGHSMRALAQAFANRLCKPTEGLPDEIMFHALAAGFDPTQPETSPNAFFSVFLNRATLQVEPKFLGLNAPAIVSPEVLTVLKKVGEIRAAYSAALESLDLVVTSGSEWADRHCGLRSRIQVSSRSVAMLEEEGCVGDILWRPIGMRGPINADTELRALSLIELSQLPQIIAGRTRVLLMLGPCGGCSRPKGRLLECVLSQKRPIITDLVVDSRTAVDGTKPFESPS